MALVIESININGKDFFHTYSDLDGYGVERDGIIYSDAYDLTEYPKQYTEVKLDTNEEVGP